MYILDIDRLEQFDIVLVRFPDDETSAAIRQTCNSNYSHAIVHLGNGSFFEGTLSDILLTRHLHILYCLPSL